MGSADRSVRNQPSMRQLARYFQFQPGKTLGEDGVFLVYIPPSLVPVEGKGEEWAETMGIFLKDLEGNRKTNRRGVYDDILSARVHEGRGTYQWARGKTPAEVSGGFSPDMKQMAARYLSQNLAPIDNYDLAQKLGEGSAKVPHELVQKTLDELEREGFVVRGPERSAVIDYGGRIFGEGGARLFEEYMEKDWMGRKIDGEAQARARAVLNCRLQQLSATNAIREMALGETVGLIEGGFKEGDVFAEDLTRLLTRGQLGLAYKKIAAEIGRLERLYDPQHAEHLKSLREQNLPMLQAAVEALVEYAKKNNDALRGRKDVLKSLRRIGQSASSIGKDMETVRAGGFNPPQYLEEVGYALAHLSETVDKAVKAQEVRIAGVLPAVLRLKPLVERVAELCSGQEPPGKLGTLNSIRKAVVALDSVYGIGKGFYSDAQGLFDRSFVLRHFGIPAVQNVLSGVGELGKGLDSVEVYVLRGVGKIEKHRGVIEFHSVSEAEAAALGDFGGRASVQSSELPAESLQTVETLLLALDEPGFPHVLRTREQTGPEKEEKK